MSCNEQSASICQRDIETIQKRCEPCLKKQSIFVKSSKYNWIIASISIFFLVLLTVMDIIIKNNNRLTLKLNIFSIGICVLLALYFLIIYMYTKDVDNSKSMESIFFILPYLVVSILHLIAIFKPQEILLQTITLIVLGIFSFYIIYIKLFY